MSSDTVNAPGCKPCCGCGHDPGSPAEETGTGTGPDGQRWQHYRIANMDCPSEEGEIRRALAGMAGVHALQFRLGERVLGIAADPKALPEALAAIRRAGFNPEALVPSADGAGPAAAGPCSGRQRFWQRWGRLLGALALALGAELSDLLGGDGALPTLLGMGMALAAIALSGLSVYGKGLAALRQRRLNINALMSVAVTGAFLIGQWPEAAMVMALYALAESIEAGAVDRARNAIQSLLALAPEEADTLQADGRWQRVPTGEVAIDATVRIRPGERIPLDGIITRGHSALDQSMITGESLPVDKAPGDPVFAGTINQSGALEVRVTAPARDSTLARIIHAVEEAQSSRAPTQRLVDRFAAVYTPAVFALAIATALLLPLLGTHSWLEAIYSALVLLVIACPCALVISTPVSVVSGLTAAARRGILIKGGVHLEQARRIRVVALDKTGTLTEGKPQLVAFEALVDDVDPLHVQRLARSLALASDHPVSRALAAGLPDSAAWPLQDFQAVAGRGTQARLLIGEGLSPCHVLANHRWIEERQQCSPALEARLREHETAGRTVTLLADEQRVLALFAVADTLRPSSRAAIGELRAEGVTPVMLTGDNLDTARAVAAQAGIDEVRAHLLPTEKLQAIDALQPARGLSAMAGDGINDAPALARADIGFAMGGAGTHTAMEAADVVIMNDDLRRLPETIRLSKRVHRILWQNIVLALGIKLVFLLLAITGHATLWMAVFADMGASLLVVINGLRLLRTEKEE